MLILHSYKCQTFFVSLPAWVRNSLACTCSAHESHARTLINVNPFLCPCLPVWVTNSLSCTCSARARKPRSHYYKCQPFLCLCVPACLRNIFGEMLFSSARRSWEGRKGEGEEEEEGKRERKIEKEIERKKDIERNREKERERKKDRERKE